MRDREAEIWSKGSRVETDEDEDGEVFEVEVPTSEAKQRAAQFGAIARGTATPIAVHHEAYMKTLKIKERSLLDDARALTLLWQKGMLT